MPGVRSISFVQKRELPSAKITEQTQELDTSCCQNRFKYVYFHPYLEKISILTNIIQMGWNHQLVYLLTINIEQCQDIMAVAISALKEKSVGCWLSDCQGTVAAVSHSLIAMDKATCQQNIGDTGSEYSFLGFVQGDVLTCYHGKSPKKTSFGKIIFVAGILSKSNNSFSFI